MTKNNKRFRTEHPYINSNISLSIERNSFRRNAPMRCSEDGILFVHDGNIWLPYEDFERRYPEIPIVKNNWNNYDKTKNYLKGLKSY